MEACGDHFGDDDGHTRVLSSDGSESSFVPEQDEDEDSEDDEDEIAGLRDNIEALSARFSAEVS